MSLNIDAIWCSPFLYQFLISGGVGCLSYKRPKKLTVSTSGNDIRGNTTIFTSGNDIRGNTTIFTYEVLLNPISFQTSVTIPPGYLV